MSSNIESVLQENRVFPPSPAFVKQANISGMDAYRKLCAEAERDFEGFWARLARENLLWHKPFTKVARRVQGAVLQVVRRRRAERLLQLPRPAPRRRQPDKIAIIFEADDGKVTQGHLQGAVPAGLPVRQRR